MRSILACTLFLALCTTSCIHNGHWGPSLSGTGPSVESSREVASFDEVSLSGGMRLDIRVGESQTVVIHAEENLQEYILTEVDGSRLKIHFDRSLHSSSGLRAEITVPSLSQVRISGSSTLDVTGVDSDEFALAISGSARGTVSGRTRALSVGLSGSAKLDLFELQAEDVQIRISGSGRIQTSASDRLELDISGSGNVTYRGHPDISIDQSGSATVRADTMR